MGFFYISAPYLQKNQAATHRQITDVVIKKSIADGKQIFLEKNKFKLANLDTLMLVNDKLLKVQNNVEGFLKKIDRQFLDLQEKQSHDWYVKSGNKEMTLTNYLYNFTWNDQKYSRAYPIARIAQGIEHRLSNSEADLRNRTNAYNQTKSSLAQNTHKEGNYFVRDLTDILVEPNVSANDFIYTKFVTTVVVIVPQILTNEFLGSYEKMTENVIPYSAKKLNVPEKDGLTIWKVNLFTQKIESEKKQEDEEKKNKRNLTVAQEFSEKAREKLKIGVKEFKFESGYADQRKKKKKQLQNKLAGQNKAISDICLALFSEIFELYAHAKILRLMVETNMRFGSDPTVIYLIETQSGKEKNVQTLLVEIFGDKESQGLYGTKDEIDDAEDFFPFIYVPTIVL